MAASPEVARIVDAISDAFAGFKPESVVPDVEGFLAHFPEIFDALSDGLKKFSGQVENDLPIHADVSDAINEMVPRFAGLADAAREVNSTFRSRHEQELDQHYNPRAGEKAWNVNA
jgi:hypothetical protein